MKILITGASGMIGKLVMNHCLHSETITEVISFVRKSTGQKHPKLTEIVLTNFEDYSGYAELFRNADAAFFCLGVYTGQVPDELFKKITVSFPVAFAKALEANSPGARFCLLSGAGSDRSEKSRTSFARYKGMAENQISKLDLQFYTFRPGYIYPVETRKEPNLGYRIFKVLYPLIKMLGKNYSIKSTELAHAMFLVALKGAGKEILENQDILKCKNH
jgi:uncharacterized protein YbjT (DUF2867 family)